MFRNYLITIEVALHLLLIFACKSKVGETKHYNTTQEKSVYMEVKYFADPKYSNDTASISYYNEDSMLISSISFCKPHVPEVEMFYSKFSSELNYGLAVFYDTIPFKVKHVEVIGVVASKFGKRYRLVSSNYLRKIDSIGFNNWNKRTLPDNYDYQIDTYH